MLDIPWRTGVNMREFAFYHTDIRPLPPASLQRDQLTKLREMRVKLVRFFAGATNATTANCVTCVRQALDLINEFGMQAIVCLDDSLSSDFAVPESGGLHTADGHYDKSYYTNRTYLQNYIPFVTEIVGQFGNHPGVMIWELGNEYALHPAPSKADIDAFFNFAKLASETIKQHSPRRLVSTGFLNSRQISYTLPDSEIRAFAKQIYSLPTIDVICVHYYEDNNEKQYGLIDIDVALTGVKKPFYIGELGADRNSDRPAYYHREIAEMKEKGAFSVLPWQFDVSAADNNLTNTWGMSKAYQWQLNPDFDELCNIVAGAGTEVEPFFAPEIESVDSVIRTTNRTSRAGTKKFFTVTFKMGLNIRADASHDAAILGGLQYGTTFEVEPDSQHVDSENEFIWWHHSRGWSAEKAVDGSVVFMEEAPKSVVQGILRGRKNAPGTLIPLVSNGSRSRKKIAKFIVDVDETVMVNALPMRDGLFTRLPVDVEAVQWKQMFGNTKYAFSLSEVTDQGTRNSYNYSQGLHAGIDLGYVQATGARHARIAVRAGVTGKIIDPGTLYNPNRVRVSIGRDYQIIYGHLSKDVTHPDYVPLKVGDEVNEDTIVGEIAPRAELLANGIGFPPHLHLEIRYLKVSPVVILNPLMFMPKQLRDACIVEPNGGYHSWTKWQNHFDQPVIRLAGPIIGPRAELD